MIRAIIELFTQGLSVYRQNKKIRKAESQRDAIRDELEKSRKLLYNARKENQEHTEQYQELCDVHKKLKARYSKSVDDYMDLYCRANRGSIPPNPYESGSSD